MTQPLHREKGLPLVVYVGGSGLPPTDASGTRILGIGLTLIHSGFNVVVLGSQATCPHDAITIAQCGGASLTCCPAHVRGASPSSRPRRLVSLLLSGGIDAVNWLANQAERPVCVIHYGSRFSAALRVTRWCRAHGVPVVADVVEHHEKWQFQPGGLLNPFFIDHLLYRRTLKAHFDGLICISDWLSEQFPQYESRRAVIRTTLDTLSVRQRVVGRGGCGSLTLGYAGSSGGGTKDLLRVIIEAVLRCCAEGIDVKLSLAGIGQEELLNMLPRGSHETSPFSALGWIARGEALDMIRRCDFMPLLRRNSMYAWAGFPTKVAESMALGTPVIVNPVGDVAKIVSDGLNGLYCESPTVPHFCAVLRRAAEMDELQVAAMRRAARDTAVREFDYRRSAGTLMDFMQRVIPSSVQVVPSRGEVGSRGDGFGSPPG